MVVNFWIKAVTMATFHLMTGRYIPHFDLNCLTFILSFGEIFLYFATSWKWYCLTFWIRKKSRLFRRFFQYSVICHYSKYVGLALTDFKKNGVFYRNCMWLVLSQIKKNSPKGTRENKHLFGYADVTKIRKTRVVSRVVIHLGARLCDAMYRVRESKSKLELFYRLFIELFCHIFLALGLNACLNGVWNYCYFYRSDLTPFKCWSDFVSS